MSATTSTLICLAAAIMLLSAKLEAEEDTEKLLQRFEEGSIEAAIQIATGRLVAGEKNGRRASTEFGTRSADAALLHDYAGDYGRAEPLYRRALEIQERTLGPDSWQARSTVRKLFALYANTGSYAKAEAMARRDPHLQEEIAVPPGTESLGQTRRAIQWSKARLTLADGWVNYLHGELERASDQANSAREITARIGANPGLSDAMNLDATVHYKRGQYDDALRIYTEALTVSIAVHYEFGNARNWSSIGSTYYRQGDYRRARENYEKSLAARRLLGNKDEIARAISDLANVHHEMGAYQRALELRQQALTLWDETGNQPGKADAMNDIGWAYQSMGEYAKALSYLRQARDIHEKVSDRWGVADDTDSIGLTDFALGNYEQALQAFRDSLRGFTELGSLEERARVQVHIGEALHRLDRLTEAETALQTALALYEKAFGVGSPKNASTLHDLALVAMDSAQKERAVELARRSLTVAETLLANVLSFTSEQQRLEFQKTTDPYSLLATLNCGPELAQTLLRNKGIVLDSLLEDRLVAEASEDPQQHQTVTRLRTQKQRLMQLSLETPRDTSPEALRKRDAEKITLSAEVEDLEAALARAVAGLGRARRALNVTVAQVQATLTKEEALIELVRYQHYLGKNKSEPRYGAVVIEPEGDPDWVGLGAAEEIEKNIRIYQKSVRGQTDKATTASVLRTLDGQVWEPIAPVLSGQTSKIILSPDGALSFVSFATLIGPEDRFLGEKYSIRYVASGRDLLRQTKAQANGTIDVFANPDFGGKPTVPPSKRRTAVALRSIEMRDLEKIRLPPLPGTALEANALGKRAGNASRVFLGGNASETELRRTHSPRVLHLATHGFFLPEIELGPGKNGALQPDEIPKGKLVNPMHRSGIALAGAETTLLAWSRGEVPPTEADGIVTAEEVGGLKLEGTELVVLSACDTGSGEARAGEGVMGLRRGFIQSGAKNVLMTLWPISDATTVQIMFDFYDAALKSGHAPQALADVQRDWLVKLRKEHGLLAAVRLAGPFIMSSQGKP